MINTALEPLDKFLAKYCTTPGKILDVGGSGSIIDTAAQSMGHQYETLNLGRGTFDVEADPYHWTMIPDNTYDYVISITTFEHIECPWLTFLEMVRVAKKDGIIYILAPSTGPMHFNVLDCWRYHPDGMKAFGKWGRVNLISASIVDNGIWGHCEGIFKK